MAINELLPVLKIIENHNIIYNTVKYMTLNCVNNCCLNCYAAK